MKTLKRKSFLLLALLLAASFLLNATGASAAAPNASGIQAVASAWSVPANLSVTFKENGTQMVFTTQARVEITQIRLVYCDGTESYFLPTIPVPVLPSVGYTYRADQQIRKAIVEYDYPAVIHASGVGLRELEVTRNCQKSVSQALFCSEAAVAPVIHQSEAVPLTFKTTGAITSAGLKFRDVNGAVTIQKLTARSASQGTAQAWKGIFSSLDIPKGDYNNVRLVVKDAAGRTTSCHVGSLLVLP